MPSMKPEWWQFRLYRFLYFTCPQFMHLKAKLQHEAIELHIHGSWLIHLSYLQLCEVRLGLYIDLLHCIAEKVILHLLLRLSVRLTPSRLHRVFYRIFQPRFFFLKGEKKYTFSPSAFNKKTHQKTHRGAFLVHSPAGAF